MRDELAIEMRHHFLTQVKDVVSSWIHEKNENENDILENLSVWIDDAIANEYPFFADFLKQKSLSTKAFEFKNLFSQLLVLIECLEVNEDDQLIFYEQTRFEKRSEFKLCLSCYWEKERFLIPIQQVIEISNGREIFPLPVPKNGFRGLMSFRGLAIPVINLKDFDFKAQDQENYKFNIVCEIHQLRFVLCVEKIEEVITIESNQLQSSASQFEYIVINNKMATWLDLEKLLEVA